MFPFFFGTATEEDEESKLPLYLYNTLSGKKEEFVSLRPGSVGMYNCGPTVYDYAHIGNFRSYVMADTIRRALEYNGFEVTQVMNITDVGHLSGDNAGDADSGEDKMTLALKRKGLPLTLATMKEVADTYTEAFVEDMALLGIKKPHFLPRATEHVEGQKALIATLMEKEYAYRTSDGVYFDTARFKEYGKLGNVNLTGQQAGARVAENLEKRNPRDFALWKCDAALGWDAPWCKGFPGWHIECSAMSMEYLGKEFDIHTGGIDHIPIHHNNEIAQSEAATGRAYARYWLHNAFVTVDGTRIGKSLGTSITLRQLVEHGYPPLAYRYWLLTSHYRSPVNFSFEALDGAAQALKRLQRFFVESVLEHTGGSVVSRYRRVFHEAINDDLNTPKALAVLWDMVKDGAVSEKDKRATLLDFDRVLGLGLIHNRNKMKEMVTLEVVALKDLPEETRLLVIAREEMREQKNWEKADEIRGEIKAQGYDIEDTQEGPKVTPV